MPPHDVEPRPEVVVAHLDEPPFCIPAFAGEPSGCDMELARIVLHRIGVGRISYRLTTFSELIPGLLDHRWHMTTGIFITPGRSKVVDFTNPIWAVPDGLLIRHSDLDRYTSYESIAQDPEGRLAVVTDQVQRQSAVGAGMPLSRIFEYPDQEAAANAVLFGNADAAASTARGNQALLDRWPDVPLTSVVVATQAGPALGAFAVDKRNPQLTAAVDRALREILGSTMHLDLMSRYGFDDQDLRPVLGRLPT